MCIPTTFLLPNLLVIMATLIYWYSSISPFSSTSGFVHSCDSFRTLSFSLSILAVVNNFVLLVPRVRTESNLRHIAAALLASAPSFLLMQELQIFEWDSCYGFDGTIFLRARGKFEAEWSYAQFPESMGGEKWTLRWHRFVRADGSTAFTFDRESNKTYVMYNGTHEDEVAFQWTEELLSFPDLGLRSEQRRIRACEWPLVALKNGRGEVIIRSVPTWHRDLARVKVCAKRKSGMNAIQFSTAAILIALEGQVNGCCLYDDGRCIWVKDIWPRHFKYNP